MLEDRAGRRLGCCYSTQMFGIVEHPPKCLSSAVLIFSSEMTLSNKRAGHVYKTINVYTIFVQKDRQVRQTPQVLQVSKQIVTIAFNISDTESGQQYLPGCSLF